MNSNSYLFKRNNLICFSFLWYFLMGFIRGELTSIVVTDKGPIQGEIRKTLFNSVPYSAFEGIPYGKPPIGKLRFKVKKI